MDLSLRVSIMVTLCHDPGRPYVRRKFCPEKRQRPRVYTPDSPRTVEGGQGGVEGEGSSEGTNDDQTGCMCHFNWVVLETRVEVYI